MKTVQIFLNSIDKVKSFVNDISKFDYDFDLVSGRYVVDAKSIMGIFSLDLSKPIDLNIHTEEGAEEVLERERHRLSAMSFLCAARRRDGYSPTRFPQQSVPSSPVRFSPDLQSLHPDYAHGAV